MKSLNFCFVIDLKELDLPSTIQLLAKEQSPYRFTLILTPDEGIFQDISVYFSIVFNLEYPFLPPKVMCISDVN